MKSSKIAFIGGYAPVSSSIFSLYAKKNNDSIFINLSDNKVKKRKNLFDFKIYELLKIINLLNDRGIKNICFIGKVFRPDLSNIKIDNLLIKYIGQIQMAYLKGDEYLLKLVIDIFKNQNFNIKSLINVVPSFFIGKNYKNIILNNNNFDENDIKKGVRLLNSISKYDNAQSAVISKGYILGIEAVEGTDKLLKRVAAEKKILKLKKNEGVLIKIPKKDQSIYADLPTIGPRTLILASKAKLNGIAIKKNKTIIYDRDKCIELANSLKLNLYLL